NPDRIDDEFGCWGGGSSGYQNLHLVTQCDGTLFFVAMCTGLDDDWADLFEVGRFQDGSPEITKVAARQMYTTHGASFEYGGGVYVDSRHRMTIYATEATTESDNFSVYINEFSGLGD